MEIPADTKRRLGLDDAPSWVMLAEASRFTWPGQDLPPPKPGEARIMAYGPLPYGLFEQAGLRFIDLLKASFATTVPRTE